MEYFWEYWEWYWFVAVLMYVATVFENAIGFRSLRSIPVRYYPPKGVGVILSGLIYDNFSEQRDFVAAILELKVMGLVTIDKKSDAEVRITRTQKRDARITPQERYMLEEILFPQGKTSYTIPKKLTRTVRMGKEKKVVLTPRGEEIVHDRYTLAEKAPQWAVAQEYMLENPRKARREFFWVTLLLVVILIVLGLTARSDIDVTAWGLMIFAPIFFIYLPIFLFIRNGFGIKLFALFLMLPVLIPLGLKIQTPELLMEFLGFPVVRLLIMLAVVEVLFIWVYEHIGVLTPKGEEVRNHLMGLKAFLTRVKLDEVQRRKEEDPEYVDKVLPYMVLLGIEDQALNLEELQFYVR